MRLLLSGDIRDLHTRRYAGYFKNRGHEVILASAEKDPRYSPDYQIKTFSGSGIVKYLSGFFSFKKVINEFKPDLINCHFLPNYGLLGLLSGFHPFVLSIWGSDILISAVRSAAHKFRATKVLNSADLVISDAEMLSRKTTELCVEIKRIITVPFGIDNAVLAKGEKRRFESHDMTRIISTRKLERLYRVGDFLDALARLSPEISRDVIIIGGGSQIDNLLERKANLGLHRVAFTGQLGHDDLISRILASDLYVSCSESDSTSVSLLEAMACGLFPIVSDIPGNREWITDGENGFLFPIGDIKALAEKITRATTDIDLRKKAFKLNIDLIIKKAVWQDNMQLIESEFIALVENR